MSGDRTASPPPLRIGIVGKGGVGKSVISGTLSRLLARRGHRVLAVDSDPMPGLAFSLGLEVGGDALLDGFAERSEENGWQLTAEPQELIERTALVGPDGVLFLQFGKVETASLQPFRSSLQALWGLTQRLADTDYTVVHDFSAGTRQAFGGWGGASHGFVMVVEPTMKSILTARRLAGLARTNNAPRIGVIANKVREPADVERIAGALEGVEVVGAVPFEPALAEADAAGTAPLDHAPDSDAVRAVDEVAATLASLWAASDDTKDDS